MKFKLPGDITLIEVLIVLVIVGILAAIAIPKFLPPPNEALEWAERCRSLGGTPHYPYRSSRVCLPPSAAIQVPR